MKNIEILKNGQVRVNGEIANYDNLLSVIDPIGEYETSEGNKIVFFPYQEGHIELLLDSDFEHGESVNYTTCTFEELMENYNIV